MTPEQIAEDLVRVTCLEPNKAPLAVRFRVGHDWVYLLTDSVEVRDDDGYRRHWVYLLTDSVEVRDDDGYRRRTSPTTGDLTSTALMVQNALRDLVAAAIRRAL